MPYVFKVYFSILYASNDIFKFGLVNRYSRNSFCHRISFGQQIHMIVFKTI